MTTPETIDKPGLGSIGELKAYCHIVPVMKGGHRGPFSLCGIPARECPRHRPIERVNFYKQFPYCPYCNLETCPKCRQK